MPVFNDSIQNYVKQFANSEPYLITSRIDNDDCINKNFINEVQKVFNQQDFFCTSF